MLWHSQILLHGNKNFLKHWSPENEEDFPFIIAGNKWDLTVDKSISKVKIDDWLSDNHVKHYFEVSAKDGNNVNEMFKETVKVIMKKER